MNIRLIYFLVLIFRSCKTESSFSSEREVLDKILSSLAYMSDSEFSNNVCLDAYDGGSRGGCFLSKLQSSELASEIYKKLTESGFEPKGILRQDYLVWTVTFETRDRNFSFLMRVDTLEDAKPENKREWEKLRNGFKSETIFSVYDQR